jgi:hypothetical protein
MAGTIYPSGIDSTSELPLVVDLVSPVLAADVNRLRDAAVAIETELGINPSGVFGTVKDRVDSLETILNVIASTDGYTVPAAQVTILDVDGYYVSTNVEGALQEMGASISGISAAASAVTIVDADGYYVSTNVEGALQEVGAHIANLTASEVALVDSDGYYGSDDVEGALAEVGTQLANLTASLIPIVDADGYYGSDDVEGALQEAGDQFASLTSSAVAVVDAGSYYDSDDVEGALQERGLDLANLTADGVAIVDSDEEYSGLTVEGVLAELALLRVDFLSGNISTLEDKTYHILTDSPFVGEITSLTMQSSSGTADGYLEIDGYSTSPSVLSISSTEVEGLYTQNNIVGYGDDLDLVTSANSSALDVKFTVKYDKFISPPGKPAIWVASRFESLADAALITEVKNYGTLGGRLTASGGEEPVFETSGTPTNSLPYGTYTPASLEQDRLTMSFSDQSGDPTILIAIVFRAPSASGNPVVIGIPSNYTSSSGAYIYNNAGSFRFRNDNKVPLISGAYTSNVWHIGAFRSTEGENFTAWIDGNTTISGNGSPTVVTAWDSIALGGRYFSGSLAAHTGEIAETLVYFGSNAPTVEEVTTYLTSIYGITPQT